MYDQKINIKRQFKDRLQQVVVCVKDKLNRDIGVSNAYDIMAVSQGIKDYQTAKGLANKPFYTVRSNIGHKDAPMWIVENIGYIESVNEANIQARGIVEQCKISLDWELFSDEQPTNSTYKSKPRSEITIQINELFASIRKIDPTWNEEKMAEEFCVSLSTFKRWRKCFDEGRLSLSFLNKFKNLAFKTHKIHSESRG